MSIPRRRITTALLAFALAGASRPVLAQAWPAGRPIRLIVGYPPGGGIDFAARTVQPAIEKALGAQLVIDYKPGASGMIAAAELARAAPDGYTVLLANTGPFAIAPHLQRKPPYDPIAQFTWIAQISEGSYVVVTRADHPANDLAEFIAWVKSRPGQVNFASAGIGTSTHLNGELLNQAADLDMTHVPYKGSAPAIQELVGGQTQVLVDAGTVLIPQVRGGRLKALAVTGAKRDPALPDVPTVVELKLPAFEAAGFQGLVGPANLPPAIVERLAGAIESAVRDDDVRAKLLGAGSEPRYRSPAEFAAFGRAENDKWLRLIRERKLQTD